MAAFTCWIKKQPNQWDGILWEVQWLFRCTELKAVSKECGKPGFVHLFVGLKDGISYSLSPTYKCCDEMTWSKDRMVKRRIMFVTNPGCRGNSRSPHTEWLEASYWYTFGVTRRENKIILSMWEASVWFIFCSFPQIISICLFFFPSQGPRDPGHGGPSFSKFCFVTVYTWHFSVIHVTSVLWFTLVQLSS